MLFSSVIFIFCFLPLVILLYYVLPKKCQNIILLFSSLLFYAWGEPKYVFLMILSIIINYIVGILLDKSKKKYNKKALLVLDIFFNLGILFFFKYFNFTLDVLDLEAYSISSIIMPIGISFFTFQIMSYVIDLYRGAVKVQKNIISLALYISFFPQLIAGPIVRYIDIEKQINNRKTTFEMFYEGIRRFIIGLGKKVLISNVLAQMVDLIFSLNVDQYGTSIAWIGIIAYTLQIYFDFSGYSDMAIGLGKMFGFTFMENFNYPYIATSIQDFWRRWHISLSRWFKDYLYIPLGGNRKGKIRTYINNLIVFFLCGLWHGAALTFIFWGLYQGFFIIIEKLGISKILNKIPKLFSHIYTIIVVLVGWVFFRADNLQYAFHYIKNMFSFNDIQTPFVLLSNLSRHFFIILIIGIVFSIPIGKKIKNSRFYKKHDKILSIIEYILLIGVLLFSVASLASNTYNPFIYFRF